jgi:hypothetical protein
MEKRKPGLKWFWLLLLVLAGCTDGPVPEQNAGTPSWYLNLPRQRETVIGYGEGASWQEAKAAARAEIARTLRVRVESDFASAMEVQGEAFERRLSSRVREYTDVALSGVRTVRKARTGGRYYVALAYDNLPLIEKVERRFRGKKLPRMKPGSLYWDAFFSRRLETVFGYRPEYTLFVKNGLYYLSIGGESFIMTQNELRLFFFEKRSAVLKVTPSARRLHPGKFFRFELAAGADGYLDFFEVDEAGRVVVHLENLPVKAGMEKVYPDPHLYRGLEAGIVTRAAHVQEMFLAALCPEHKDLSVFDTVTTAFDRNEDAIRYPALRGLLRDCETASVVLRIDAMK